MKTSTRFRTSPAQASQAGTQGFTLIEILVSIAILGILAAVLTSTLTGTLSLNQRSQRQLDTSARAQQLLESIRGAWAVPPPAGTALSVYYDRACAPSTSVSLDGLSARYINLNSRAQPINGSGVVQSSPSAVDVTVSANCPTVSPVQMGSGSTSAPYPMRRLIVSSGSGPQDVTLTLDLLRPQ